MPKESTSSTNFASYPSSTNGNTLRLSTDSNQDIDINNNNTTTTNKKQQPSNQNTTVSQNNSSSSGRVSRSQKSGLLFSVSRVENRLRKGRYAERLSAQASVYLACVLEYLVAETLELAGDITHQEKRKRVTPRDIALAIKNDDELAKLCADVTIPEGGVQPHIHQVLLKPTQRPRRRQVRFSQENTSSSNKSKATNRQSTNKKHTDTDGNLSSNSSDEDDTDVRME